MGLPRPFKGSVVIKIAVDRQLRATPFAYVFHCAKILLPACENPRRSGISWLMEQISKLSVNVPNAIAKRLRKLRVDHGLSASSIVEVALTAYFEGRSDAAVARSAKDQGATLRRDPTREPG